MMRSSRLKKRSPEPAAQQETTDLRAVHIVFALSVSKQTGAQLSKQVIGVFDDPSDAKNLEDAFNRMDCKAQDVTVKAFTLRYALPYMLPMVKEMMGKKAVQA